MAMKSYYVDDMPNAEYHAKTDVLSASSIKPFIDDHGQYIWNKTAAKDPEKLKTLDFGTDFHSYFLEPDVFAKQYQVLPPFNRRKKDEKQAELDLIAQWDKDGIIAVTHEDMAKLKAMRDSALAHPVVADIMARDGVAERSIFWTDAYTGVDCRCRPDWLLDVDGLSLPYMVDKATQLVVDIKTIGQMDKVQKQIEDLKYFVQDPFYRRGVQALEGGKADFIFIFVSTTMQIGRYPVRVIRLNDLAVRDGDEMISTALVEMSRMKELDYLTVEGMDRPHWAMNEEAL